MNKPLGNYSHFKYLSQVNISGVLGLPTTNHTCQHDKYACGDGTCIPVNWVCDGDVDCKNEMDEHECGMLRY